MKKEKIVFSIVIFIVSALLVASAYIQIRTVEKTNLLGIESMREEELREEIVEWKAKYNEISEKLNMNQQKINEYTNNIKNNQLSSELLDKELSEYNMLVGKTNVIGNGIIIKITDIYGNGLAASSLVDLINELKYAEAEAISINGQRIINMTDIVEIADKYILINGERISGPYEIRVIGNQEKLEEVLNYPDTGFISYYKSMGYKIELNKQNDVKINAYKKPIVLKYINEGE